MLPISHEYHTHMASKSGPFFGHFGNQQRSDVGPYVAKSNFETYKSYDHMPKIIPISQKFNEILRFENFEITRFCHTLTHGNRYNSLSF